MNLISNEGDEDGEGSRIPARASEMLVGTVLPALVAIAVFALFGFAISASNGDNKDGLYVLAFIKMYRTCGSLSTLLFALSGARAAILAGTEKLGDWKRLTNIFLSGILTGVGGGVFVRDPILLREPTALADPSLLAWALVGTTLAIALTRDWKFVDDVIDALDFVAVGMTAVFAVDVAVTHLPLNTEPGFVNGMAVFIAIASAAGGGLVRDLVILRRPPYAATSAYVGVILMTTLVHGVYQMLGGLVLTSDPHNLWPVTVAVALLLGMSTRNYRMGVVSSTFVAPEA